jgi:3-hydroxyisobutyrate dehydrogenase-like beta-hydroxyacid dehydrogenase
VEKIGMIGTGAMGLALLERLKLAGTAVVCYDAYPPALEQARELGMRTVQRTC